MELTDGRDRIAVVRSLIEEYTDSLGLDLSFQNLDAELDDPAGKYAPPHGQILLAMEGEKALGMVAWHWLDETGRDEAGQDETGKVKRGEVKRLYVRPEARREGIAAKLMEGIIASARECGCNELVLDTLTSMTPARNLYARFGFEECAPYYFNPLDNVVYMKLVL